MLTRAATSRCCPHSPSTDRRVRPSSQTELFQRLGVDGSDMVALVNHLERQRHVTRPPDPVDRRRNSVSLTP